MITPKLGETKKRPSTFKKNRIILFLHFFFFSEDDKYKTLADDEEAGKPEGKQKLVKKVKNSSRPKILLYQYGSFLR